MEKKNLDWANIGFEYVQTDKRYVANYKDGKCFFFCVKISTINLS